jgi:hypothetical protein
MRTLFYAILIFMGVVAIVVVLFVWPAYRLFRSFELLEQNARAKITGTELQSWATNLLAHHPPGYTTVERLGTNFPRQLIGLYRHQPSILIYESTTNKDDSVNPGWVRVVWGSGFMGHTGFEIGPTNFRGYKRGNEWQEGVYFYKDQAR